MILRKNISLFNSLKALYIEIINYNIYMGVINYICQILKDGMNSGIENSVEKFITDDIYPNGKKTIRYFKNNLMPKYEKLDDLDSKLYSKSQLLDQYRLKRKTLEKEQEKG